MLSASHVAESLRDSVVLQRGCGVSLGEADLRGGAQRDASTIYLSTSQISIKGNLCLTEIVAFQPSRQLHQRSGYVLCG